MMINNHNLALCMSKELEDIRNTHILPHLSFLDCGAMGRVCKQWNKIFTPFLDEKLWDHAVFGKKKWLQVSGIVDVSNEPELTPEKKMELINWLKEKCQVFNVLGRRHGFSSRFEKRFEEGKTNRNWQTHVIVLFPGEINGEAVTADRINHMFSFAFGRAYEEGAIYESRSESSESESSESESSEIGIGEDQPPKAYFAKVSLSLIPNTRAKGYDSADFLPKNCRAPTYLEALISLLVINLDPGQKRGKYYFKRDYTLTTPIELYGTALGDVSCSGVKKYWCDYDLCYYTDIGLASVEEVL